LLSLLPIKVTELELLDEPLEELLDEPLEVEPPLGIVPPGNVKVVPLVAKTTLPVWSVRYTEMPAEESLVRAAEVG